ncbi:zinc finger and BTB domain-containing protein 21 isoform X1 [Rhincodon typus]|uniref:zinc finger and BTB domain-containing protein 21 isoform X1 n=1 Tax=Rhincodon typus TaxID=259920 RepID=UPI00202FA5B2|nr:zinc finger and BTB domain-containing protein 21 isoform X1 [Rhincodon typus]
MESRHRRRAAPNSKPNKIITRARGWVRHRLRKRKKEAEAPLNHRVEQTMEGLLHYINPAHAISLLSALNEDRLKGQLCDVVLIVGDHKFRAHKNVLAASSDYFRSLFTKKENESQSVFQLDLCEAAIFENILNYIYSSSLFIEKKSLSAIHSLGGNLGISFLTSIPSQTPQISCAPNSVKKHSKVGEDLSSAQPRSVIVCQSRSDLDKSNAESEAKGGDSSQKKGPSEEDPSHSFKSSSLNALRANSNSLTRDADTTHLLDDKGQPLLKDIRGALGNTKFHSTFKSLDDQNRLRFWSERRNSMSADGTSGFTSNVSERRQSLTDLLINGKPLPRPQLSPAFSFHGTTGLAYSQQKPGNTVNAGKTEESNLLYYTKVGSTVQPGRLPPSSQSVVSSGPLVKSLLRRSLSMDSQVPSYSSSLDLKMTYGSQICKREPLELTCDASSQKPSITDSIKQQLLKEKPKVDQSCRPKQLNVSQAAEADAISLTSAVKVKTEPCSPASDTSDIITVTVGETSPCTSKEFAVKNVERNRRTSMLPMKRRFLAENAKLSYEKSETLQHSPNIAQSFEENSSPTADDTNLDLSKTDENKDEYSESESAITGKQFKCMTCFKIFRSTAGLFRHVDMYHNPDKPYACDICHKRFLTNFKVWTHCQTQHGVVINPSAATSSSLVPEEKFQKKLNDMMREREIKKALFHKLRRRQGSHSYPGLRSEQAFKKNLKSASKGVYICTTCGKLFRFLSRYRQHMKTHPGEKPFVCKLYNRAFKSKEQAVTESVSEDNIEHQCEHCNTKMSSLAEKTKHERICRNVTVCCYCSLRFCSRELKQEHENQCEYKKLTCLECKRTFKSSFSIWRHQIEVHNENTMAPVEKSNLDSICHNGVLPKEVQTEAGEDAVVSPSTSKEYDACSDSSEPMYVDSEDSSCFPEDLSISNRRNISSNNNHLPDVVSTNPIHLEDVTSESKSCSGEPEDLTCKGERGLWPCEKCGKIFTIHKQLERHQELLCAVKPFICHVCHKAFRTNFRLWSHFQSHISQSADRLEFSKPVRSPSCPPPPPPPPLPVPPQERSPEPEQPSNHSDKTGSPQAADTLFTHAPPLAAATFERPFMCKFCRRTFKTAFSLWSHEQTHN